MWHSSDEPTGLNVSERIAEMFPNGSAHLRSATGSESFALVEESFAGPDVVEGAQLSGTGEAVRRYRLGDQIVSVTTHQGLPAAGEVADLLDAAVVTAASFYEPISDGGIADVYREVRAGSKMPIARMAIPRTMQDRGARQLRAVLLGWFASA